MRRTTFAKCSALAFGLVASGFVLRGFSRLVVSAETATALSAPLMLLGGGLVAVLTLRSALAVSGLRPLR